MAAHYKYSETEWGYVAVELAGRLSSPSLDCASKVIEALPAVPEAGSMLRDAAEGCHNGHYPGCAYIDRAIASRNARLAP